jgi:hypothetical protein
MSDAPTNQKPEKKKLGRPLEYTKEMGDYICELTASTGYGLLKLTRLYPELPDKMTINRWRHRLPDFRAQYALAKLEQADILAEECLEIADDDSQDIRIDEDGNQVCNTEFTARSRLRVDTRKWLAAKLLPKQYGPFIKDDQKSSSESVLEQILSGKIQVKND